MTDNQNGYGAQYGIDRHKVALTLFVNHAAKTAEQVEWTLPHMADVIVAENRAEKRKLPWFKLALFGTMRTAKGSLRHDANVLKITGVENEHDSGRLSFDGAVALLREAGVRCVVYTSPSHLVLDNGVAVEKWRVMAPTSQPLDPAIRYQLAARINGVIKGVSTAESFTLSQSFYYGSVQKNPEHWAEVIDGEFIDLCDDLDVGAIGVPERGKKGKKRATSAAAPDASPAHTAEDIDAMLEHCRIHMHSPKKGLGWHARMLSVTASLVGKMWTDEAIREKCGPSCVGGEYDDELTKLLNSAREKWGIADPAANANEFESLLREFAAECAAAGVKGPGFRTKERAQLRLTDFYAFLPTHQYILRHTGEMWLPAGVNATLDKVKIGTEPKKVRKKDKQDPAGEDEFVTVDVLIPASVWLDRNRPVSQVSWMPGMPELIEGEVTLEGGLKPLAGACIYNMYQPPTRRRGDPGRAGPWLELVKHIYPEHWKHIVRFLAHRIQRAEEKINHALVLTGSPGIGKDTILEPLRHGVGPWNFKEVSPQDITSNNNDYMKSVALRISEARDLGEVNKFKMYEAMKTILAAPPDMIRVNVKYVPQYYVVNITAVIITTNYPSDGLYLIASDRRHYVAGTEASKDDFDADYWTGMWRWYRAGGLDDVVAYLSTVDLRGFDAKAPPEKTPAFWRMVAGNTAPEVAGIHDAIDRLSKRNDDNSVVPPTVITLDMVRQESAKDDSGLHEWLSTRSNLKLIHHRLETCGYVPVRNTGRGDGFWIVGGARKVVYGLMSADLSERMEAAKALCSERAAKSVS